MCQRIRLHTGLIDEKTRGRKFVTLWPLNVAASVLRRLVFGESDPGIKSVLLY